MTAERLALVQRQGSSQFRGFLGLLRVELRVWFPWRFAVLILAGVGVFVSIYLPWRLVETNRLGPLLYFSLGLWMAVILIGTISLMEGTVLGDIERGTASWLVGLPVGRPAVISAKFVASAFGLSAAVFATGLLFYPLYRSASELGVTDFTVEQLGETTTSPIGNWGAFATLPDLGSYLSMLLAIALLATFLAALMILFGTLLRSRTGVFGLGLVNFGALVGGWFVGRETLEASPIGLVGVVSEGLQNRAMTVTVPAIATFVLSCSLVALAIWRFQRKELR
jgi:hypothetical protein